MTFIFLVLMVKPKLSQALEKLFTHRGCCISATVAAADSAVIRKEELSQCGYIDLCFCFESSEVEHSSVGSVPQLDHAIVISL